MEKVVFTRERPSASVFLPKTGITVEVYSSLLLVDTESFSIGDITKGNMAETKKMFVRLIKSWNWYDKADDAEPMPINEETIGYIEADDLVVLMKGIEDFKLSQKKS